jgi:hypothetical protein
MNVRDAAVKAQLEARQDYIRTKKLHNDWERENQPSCAPQSKTLN